SRWISSSRTNSRVINVLTLLVHDLLLAAVAAADHLLVADFAGRKDIEVVALHAFGVELGGDFSRELLAGLPLCERGSYGDRRQHAHTEKPCHGHHRSFDKSVGVRR